MMLKISVLLSWISFSQAARAEWWKYLTKKGDRDRFYRHHVQNKTLVFESVDYYFVIDDCLTQELGVEGRAEIQQYKTDNRSVGRMLKDPVDDLVYLVAVESAISPEHANAVRALAKCVRLVIPKLYEVRAMYREEELDFDPGLGGNCPTHLAPLLGVFFPSVVREMQATLQFAYDAANWADWHMDNGVPPRRSLPSPDMVGFRASEHLTYNEFKEGLNAHRDGSDTFYTMNFAFVDPQDYDGGFFYILNRNEDFDDKVFLKPKKYSAMVFLGGHLMHGVTQIKHGVREMFSSEMWAYPDTPFGSSLWNNTAARFQEYINLCNQQEEEGHVGPCTVNLTKIDIDEEIYIENFNFERSMEVGWDDDEDDGDYEEDEFETEE